MIVIETERLDGIKELTLITNVIYTKDKTSMSLYEGKDCFVIYYVDVDGVTKAGLESLWKILKDDNFRKGIWTFDKLDTVVKK